MTNHITHFAYVDSANPDDLLTDIDKAVTGLGPIAAQHRVFARYVSGAYFGIEVQLVGSYTGLVEVLINAFGMDQPEAESLIGQL